MVLESCFFCFEREKKKVSLSLALARPFILLSPPPPSLSRAREALRLVNLLLTESSQVVRDVPHAPVRPTLLGREPRRQDPRAARAAEALKDPVERPERAEPRHPGPRAEGDVDRGGGHEPAREHQARGGAGAEDARDELGHAVGDREEGGEGPDLFFFFLKVFFVFFVEEKTKGE